MIIDNKTILIVGLIIMAIISLCYMEKDIALAISSGLVGYLSKDIVTSNNTHEPPTPVLEEDDDESEP